MREKAKIMASSLVSFANYSHEEFISELKDDI